MKIIIQAGGLGTRMKNLTSVKPKPLISAKHLPIIFHMFKKYPRDEFIIIGDYKFDVLDRYLETFAKDVNYMLIHASGTGNAPGIKEAVSYIPDNEPFMIIWSDIILSADFCISEIKNGCQVGLADFPCSWSVTDGRMEKVPSQGDNGLGGLFIFNNKSWFDDFPEEGSLAKWLQAKGMPISTISMAGSTEVGTFESYQKVNQNDNHCRPYNQIEFIDGRVVKTALTPEAEKLLECEAAWYEKMSEYGFKAMPQVYGTDPLTLDIIDGTNVFMADLDDNQKKRTLDSIIAELAKMHGYETVPADTWDIYTEYFKKTIHRLLAIQNALPFGFDETIKINGRQCMNILYNPHVLRQAVMDTLMNAGHFHPIHGDCQLSNTMTDKDGRIYFIDARGYFGRSRVMGDARYDWAKVYYAIAGNFDQFNIKNFELEINGGADFKIHSGGWEHLTEHFLTSVPAAETDIKEIKLIHAIIWLSLASHAWDCFDSMCVAFYNGTLLFNEWMDEYGYGK